MCNARRHSEGCGCGFGPPYPGSIGFDPPVKWEEAVVDNPWLLKSGLTELNWDKESIDMFIRRYNEIVSSELPREGIIAKIKNLLGKRRIEVVESKKDEIDIPLFTFGAPKITGSKISYQEALTSEKEATWRIKVFGIGTGDTRSMSLKNVRKFIAKNGECKVIYAPIPMKVESVSIFEKDKLVGSGFRAEVLPPKNKDTTPLRRRGCKSLSRQECEKRPDGHVRENIEVDLSGDKSNSIYQHDTSWKSSLAEDISVGLTDMVNLSASVKIRHIREIAIKCQLPTGRNYLGRIYSRRLWWKV